MTDKNSNYIKRIIAVALPIALSNLVSQLQLLIDRMFIGRLSLDSVSAVSNATTPFWTTMSTVFALTTGATIVVSQAYGANEIEKAKSYLAALFKFNNVFGIGLFLFWILCPQIVFRIMGVDESIIGMSIDYARYCAPVFIFTGIGSAISCMLEVSQKTVIMIAYGLTRSLTNIALDYILIFGHFGFPAMGVKGAAIATTIAELIGDLVVLIYSIMSTKLPVRPSMNQIIFSKLKPYLGTIRFGIPAACEEFAWNIGNLYLLVMLNKISVEAAGIHAIVFGVELIAVELFVSIGTATLTLSGFETGKKSMDGVWNVVKWSLILCGVISVVNVVLFMIFPTQILSWFTTDEAVISAAPLYLLIVGIDLFPKSGNIIVGSGIKGYGDPRWMMLTQLFGTVFVISASTVLVMVLHRGIFEIFCMVVADETIRLIFNAGKLRRVIKNGFVSADS